MADLLGDGDSDDNSGFNINKSYADKYDTWRGKEELQKFADRYGEEALAKMDHSDESSTSTEEDDDAKEVTTQFEKQFFKTLSCLKKKDPKIYDSNVKFFEKKVSSDEQDKAASQKKKKEKKMFLRDYERKMLLERGGLIDSDEEQEEERACSPTFVQEQKAIKQSFKAVLNNDSDEDETEEIGGLLKPRQKTEEEKTREEEEYREWLKGRKKELSNEEDSKDLSYLKDYWNDPQLEQNEAFLRDYILNKRYLEEEDNKYIPTYDELVHDSDEGGLSGDERTVEEMERFEHKYNFRYEEPDQEFVKRYPRTTQSSLRLQDDRRRKHREEVRQRKIQEKEAKRHELLQLKAIKRKEITERLEKLKEITGNTDIQFMDEDLNEDFDPEKHDQRMQKLFDAEYYNAEADEEKPEWPDLDAELEIEKWDEYQPEEEGTSNYDHYEPHCEDPNFNMDCDYDPRAELQKEMMAAQTGRKKKNRRRSKLAELLAKKKPKFDPSQQQVDKYMDEYYALDYEDIVGDMPCRFKYRNVVANDYGLTIDEILRADDKELNRWCSLKKTSQYRSEQQERYDVHAYKKKAQLEALKRKILPSLFKNINEDQENPEQEEKTKKKKKKKKSKKGTGEGESFENGAPELAQDGKKAKKIPHSENDLTSSSSTKKKIIKEEMPETEEPIKVKQEMPESETIEIKQEVSDTGESMKKKKRKISSEEEVSTERKSGKQKKCSVEETSQEHKFFEMNIPSQQNGSPVNGEKSKKNKDKANKYRIKSTQKLHNKQQHFSKQKSSNRQEDPVPGISDSRLKAYGFNPKKYKNKLKYGKKN